MDKTMSGERPGYTIVELIVTMVVFALVAAGVFGLLVSFIRSASIAQTRSTALAIATEQIERLRILPYSSLAVQGGMITASSYLPATQTVSRGNLRFTVQTNIDYVDDAYDGCFNYPTQALQTKYCRNGPPKTGAPVDNNPHDYKIAEVNVISVDTGVQLATLSSEFSARVAELSSNNTSMIIVKVIDSSGNGVANATVRVTNSTLSPAVDQSGTTDDNGAILFPDVPPDTGPDYVITASKSGYSTLTTIPKNGSLIPNYPNVTAISQNVTSATLQIDPISSTSLQLQTVSPAGAAVASVPVDIQGGIKLYTDAADTTYSYSQTVTTDASGTITLSSLVPGSYQVCYTASAKCGGSTYYLAAAQTTLDTDSFQPFNVPSGSTPTLGMPAMQVVKLFVTTNSAFPRITSMSPTQASTSASGANATVITVVGANLSGATVKLIQGATTVTSTVSGTDTATSIKRQFDISGLSAGAYQVQVTTAAGTIVQTGLSPGTLGGFNALP